MGLVPARGRWSYERFATSSTATFRAGSLVKLNAARDVSEYSGGEASFLGIAMQNSVNSLPAGYVIVALPTGDNCTFIADIPAGIAQSSISLGETVGIVKSGNTVSLVTTSYTSELGRPAIIRGLIRISPTSTVECTFNQVNSPFPSADSQAFV